MEPGNDGGYAESGRVEGGQLLLWSFFSVAGVGATGVVEQLNANLPGLERVLPTGARLLSAALAEAAD